MSQTLPDLIVSPCPIREPWVAWGLRFSLLQCATSTCEGFSWHDAGLYREGAVVYWSRYVDFGEQPIGELSSCNRFYLGTVEDRLLSDIGWLRARIPQIPELGSLGTFNAVYEEAVVAVDVRVCATGAYFRLHDRLIIDVDWGRCLGFRWAPEEMEEVRQFEGDEVVHFAPKQPPKREWTLFRLFQRLAGSTLSEDRERRAPSSQR